MNNAAIEEIRKRSAENKTVDDYRRMPVSEIAKMRLDIKRLLKAIDAPLQVVHGRWETVKKGSSMHHKCNNCGFSAGVGRKYN